MCTGNQRNLQISQKNVCDEHEKIIMGRTNKIKLEKKSGKK
jgi:hypothetical protein